MLRNLGRNHYIQTKLFFCIFTAVRGLNEYSLPAFSSHITTAL